MKFLLDTHVLIWGALYPYHLSLAVQEEILDPLNEIFFSAVCIWEVSIKYACGRKDFPVEPRALRRSLIDNGYTEIAITSTHALAVGALPPIHRDPFDRILIAQAISEGITLLTADAVVAKYPGPIRQI